MSITDKAKDRAKKNPTWLLLILLGIHLIVISINRAPGNSNLYLLQVVLSTMSAPFQSGISKGGSWFSGLGEKYFSFRNRQAENEQLKSEREKLQSDIIGLRERVKLLEQSKDLKEWQDLNKYSGVQAQVIARDANRFFNTVVIDAGANLGVAKDQPVITVDGLVGRVINVWPVTSQVLLITDERHGAGAVIGQTGESRLLGVVKGKSEYMCEMRFIAPPQKIENGEEVVTSGQDGIYPKGLLIGRVKLASVGSAVVPQVVDLEPAASLGKLDAVSVLAIPPELIRRGSDQVTAEDKKEEKKQDKTSAQRAR